MSELIPFATVQDLQDRWPDFPAGAERFAATQLEDASQYILDVCPTAVAAPEATRRRVVCAVVRRAMQADAAGQVGVSQFSETAGPFSHGVTPSNPNGDFYLTKQELKSLGGGNQAKAFSVSAGGPVTGADHRPWCSLFFGAVYCSCGADLTGGEPLWEA